MAGEVSLSDFYIWLCKRCLCKNDEMLQSGFSKIICQIETSVTNDADETERLMGLSILRLAGELIKLGRPCKSVYAFLEQVTVDCSSNLINCMSNDNIFIRYLSKKVFCLLLQHFPEKFSTSLTQLCRSITSKTSQKFEVITEILKYGDETVETSDFNLAGQESLVCNSCVSSEVLKSQYKSLLAYKTNWLEEINKYGIKWFQEYGFCSTPLLQLYCQLLTSTSSKKRENLTAALINFELETIFLNISSSCSSVKLLMSTLANLLTGSDLSTTNKQELSTQFLHQIKKIFKVDSVTSKQGDNDIQKFQKCCYDSVVARNVTLCSLSALSNTDDSHLSVFLCLHTLLRNSVPDSTQKSYEKIIIHLFLDQDDQLVDMILCHFDLYIKYEAKILQYFNPFKLFLEFLQALDFDHSVVLDMLTSNETRMLFLLVRFLKLSISEWNNFLEAQNENLEKTMSVFIRLNLSIERLETKGIFPYKAKPLLKLLNQLEECYENM